MTPGNSYRWVTGFGLLVTGTNALVAISAGLGHRLGEWHYETGFRILFWTTVLGIPAILLCLLGAFLSVGKSRRSMMIGAAAIAIGLVVVVVPIQWQLSFDRLPKIHDITTDTDDPPLFTAAARLRLRSDHSLVYARNDLALKQKAAYPDVRPLFSHASKEHIFVTALSEVRAMGLEVVASSSGETPPGDATVEAVGTTTLFGFRDDLVIRIRQMGDLFRIDARSQSRVGASDLGENARRLRRLLSRLRAKLG